MSVVTRFAPSPTGYLHIGGARTALFNWLFARRMGGQYLLRIEDTDRARSTPEAIDAIHEGLDWLGLTGDAQTVYQSTRASHHQEVVEEMVRRGGAFKCYLTAEELEAVRAKPKRPGPTESISRLNEAIRRLKQGDQKRPIGTGPELADLIPDVDLPDVAPDKLINAAATISELQKQIEIFTPAFRSPYRDGKTPPSPHAPFVVRLRAPDEGDVLNADLIQGDVRVKARDIDDLVLLRADGNPTYMLSVVVDDHDMGVTHVIRGDDHLTNAARQIPIFQALGWTPPQFAHVPLIHGEDGKKLSKRHGAQAVHEWRDMGYLPEAMNAYLMRLGWSPGHDDILTKEEAAPQFELGQIGKAPSRLDFKKLDSVNAHFMALADDKRLAGLVLDHLARAGQTVSPTACTRIERAVPLLKQRAKTLLELADLCRFLIAERPLALDEKAKSLIKSEAKERLGRLHARLAAMDTWEHVALAGALKAFAADEGVGLGQIGPALRAALSGGGPAPDLGQALEMLGRDEALARISDQV